MRFERAKDIVELATLMQARRNGVTIDEIQQQFSVSKRTAERMRDAVDSVFRLEEPERGGDRKLRWRLQSDALRRLVPITTGNLLAPLATVISLLRQTGRDDLAHPLQELDTRLRAIQRPQSLATIDSDLETLMQAEGLAMRPGPRQPIDPALLVLLREAILNGRLIAFSYTALHSGEASSQQVEPYGLLYGNRPFLVGKHAGFADLRLWRIGNISASTVRLTDQMFRRDPEFDLQAYARRSFGTFQEDPIEIELRFNQVAAPDAAQFQFHPDQTIEQHRDGTLTVRFKAGGRWEICRHLVNWGDTVQIIKPAELRQQMAEMCQQLANHHQQG